MKLLAFDTSTEFLSIGLHVNGEFFSSLTKPSRKQAENILPEIQAVLRQARIELQELDAIGFGRGPGSFMGVRLSCSIAQGLGFSLNKPLIPISSLQACAQTAADENQLKQAIALIDARMEEWYWGLYRTNSHGLMQLTGEEQLSILSEIPNFDIPHHLTHPSPAALIKLTLDAFQQGKTITAFEAEPVYLRNDVTN